MNSPPPFSIFIHVPKTAGTAVARIMEEAYSGRIFYDYGTERSLEDARTPSRVLLHNRASMMSHYRMIYGHFHYLKYAELFYDSQFLSMVRDPISRAVSHYYHIARDTGPGRQWLSEKVVSGEWNIVQMHQNATALNHVLRYYFEGRKLEDYSFIVIQEDLYPSLRACAKKLEMAPLIEHLDQLGDVPVINERPEISLPDAVETVTEEHLGELEALLAEDRKIYDEIASIFGV